MSNIYQILENLDISYQKYEHPAVFTVEESEKYDFNIDCGKCKNLFLRNKKGDKHFLIILESTKTADLQALAKLLNETRLSFASPDRMMQYLGVTPGSVSPFGLIHDTQKHVHVVVDNALLKQNSLGYHPNINTQTLVISTRDFQKFLNWTQNSIIYADC